MVQTREKVDPRRTMFLDALTTLRSGKIPTTMPFVAAYISNTTKELMEYTHAITECAIRLQNSNKVLRDMANALQTALKRKLARDSSAWKTTADYAEVITYLGHRIQYEMDNNRQRDAEMLSGALDAVLLVVSDGRGTAK